jgi:hypothetical protein
MDFGVTAKVCCDKGLENVDVASFMLNARGVGVSSVITGRSVRNQRIERLWGDVFQKAIKFYKDIFEELHYIHNVDFGFHLALFCLYYLFIDKINMGLLNFKNSWNVHQMSTEGNRTPLQLKHMFRHK